MFGIVNAKSDYTQKKHSKPNTMKTISTIRRKGRGIIAILFVLMMSGSGLHAQKSLNRLEIQDLSGIILKGMKEISIALEIQKEISVVMEEEIILEDWMMNLEKWAKSLDSSDVNKNNSASSLQEQDMIYESELELEGWMLNSWKVNATDKEQMVKNSSFDEELELESWMTSPAFWVEKHQYSQR